MSRVDRPQSPPAFVPVAGGDAPEGATRASGDRGSVGAPREHAADGLDSSPEEVFPPLSLPPRPRPAGPDLPPNLAELTRELTTFLRTGTAPPTSRSPSSAGAASGPPEAVAIARNLEAIDTKSGHTTKTVANHGAEALNAILARNVEGKSTRYRQVVNADRALSGANVTVDKASRGLAAAQAKYHADPSDKNAKAVATAEKKLNNAITNRTAAEVRLATAEEQLRDFVREKLGDKAADHEAQIAALTARSQPITRDQYTIAVGAATVNLHNGVDAYATVTNEGLTGSASGDGPQRVQQAIDRAPFSQSTKNVLLATSANEGSFSSINGYDKKGISFGLIQLAGGRSGDTLSVFLDGLKKQHPQVFQETLQSYGIDVERGAKGPEIVVRQPDGNTLRGQAAAEKIGTDPKLAAALSASGLRPEVQDSQVAFAKRNYLDSQRGATVSVGGQSVKISELITSERGNGLLFDRSVQEGVGGARRALTTVVDTYLEKNPGARLSDEAVRAEIEAAYLSSVLGRESLKGRNAHIVAATSDKRGSYAD